jgi:hypothetical protein
MSDFPTDQEKRDEETENRLQKIEGHLRAFDAILLELPEVTPDLIRTAKDRLRSRWKNNRRNRGFAEMLDQINSPYDNHAEAALDKLVSEAESKKS